MKKYIFALLSILFLVVFASIPAYSSDDEDSGNPSKSSDSANNNKDTTIESYSYTGVSKYQKFVVDSAVATLSKRGDGTIQISLNTGIASIAPTFDDVNIHQSGDTTWLTASKESVEVLGGPMVANLTGYQLGTKLYLEVTSADLPDTLFFCTDKSMVTDTIPVDTAKQDSAGKGGSVVNNPSKALQDSIEGTYSGIFTFTGESPLPKTAKVSLENDGTLTIDLDSCYIPTSMGTFVTNPVRFSAMSLLSNGHGYSFSGTANSSLNYMQMKLPLIFTLSDGNWNNGELQFTVSTVVMNKTYSVTYTGKK